MMMCVSFYLGCVYGLSASSSALPFADVLAAYWKLHVSHRTEAMALSSLLQGIGLPLQLTSEAQLRAITTSATLVASGLIGHHVVDRRLMRA